MAEHPRAQRGDLVAHFAVTRMTVDGKTHTWEEFLLGRVTSVRRTGEPSKWRREDIRRIEPIPPPHSAMVFSAKRYDVLAIINDPIAAEQKWRIHRDQLRPLLDNHPLEEVTHLD